MIEFDETLPPLTSILSPKRKVSNPSTFSGLQSVNPLPWGEGKGEGMLTPFKQFAQGCVGKDITQHIQYRKNHQRNKGPQS